MVYQSRGFYSSTPQVHMSYPYYNDMYSSNLGSGSVQYIPVQPAAHYPYPVYQNGPNYYGSIANSFCDYEVMDVPPTPPPRRNRVVYIEDVTDSPDGYYGSGTRLRTRRDVSPSPSSLTSYRSSRSMTPSLSYQNQNLTRKRSPPSTVYYSQNYNKMIYQTPRPSCIDPNLRRKHYTRDPSVSKELVAKSGHSNAFMGYERIVRPLFDSLRDALSVAHLLVKKTPLDWPIHYSKKTIWKGLFNEELPKRVPHVSKWVEAALKKVTPPGTRKPSLKAIKEPPKRESIELNVTLPGPKIPDEPPKPRIENLPEEQITLSIPLVGDVSTAPIIVEPAAVTPESEEASFKSATEEMEGDAEDPKSEIVEETAPTPAEESKPTEEPTEREAPQPEPEPTATANEPPTVTVEAAAVASEAVPEPESTPQPQPVAEQEPKAEVSADAPDAQLINGPADENSATAEPVKEEAPAEPAAEAAPVEAQPAA